MISTVLIARHSRKEKPTKVGIEDFAPDSAKVPPYGVLFERGVSKYPKRIRLAHEGLSNYVS